jgi:2-polyprenyl-6-methoxyphenol hydroxylase-like FAD-dependent oxidoreductase
VDADVIIAGAGIAGLACGANLADCGRLLAMHSSRLPPPLHGLPNIHNTLRCVSLRDVLSNLRVAWRAALCS